MMLNWFFIELSYALKLQNALELKHFINRLGNMLIWLGCLYEDLFCSCPPNIWVYSYRALVHLMLL